MTQNSADEAIASKMRAAGLSSATIAAFRAAVARARVGERGMLPEQSLTTVESLLRLDDLPPREDDKALLSQLVVLKLNGGLGTSMGLDKPRSLLPVKGSQTFLDFIAQQLLFLRQETKSATPAFFLMDSFSTQEDTLQYLSRYPDLGDPQNLDFLQSMVPKLTADTLEPVEWPLQPDLEWCPPGHGDLYASLLGTGVLDVLLDRGIRYMFASNADNLGATVDLGLLAYLIDNDLSFLMEVADRTEMDRKGGHLARLAANGRLVLREAAQCPPEDADSFQDIGRYRYFNTNSLWLNLVDLKSEMSRNGGALPLPLITNVKTVDPRNSTSTRVLQLESAMGAAIASFSRAAAVVVPRARFTPVKNTSDLLLLRSDACRVTDDFRLVLDERRGGVPPVIDLDQDHYRLITDFDRLFERGVPSLIACRSLKVTGPVEFAADVSIEGDVSLVAHGDQR